MDLVSIFLPHIAYADFNSFLNNLNSLIINPLIRLLFALAIAYFLYGVFVFLTNADNENERTAGKNHMLYGVVGLTVMMGVWGILNLVLNTLNIQGIDPESGTVELNDYTPSTPNAPSTTGAGSGGSGGGTTTTPNPGTVTTDNPYNPTGPVSDPEVPTGGGTSTQSNPNTPTGGSTSQQGGTTTGGGTTTQNEPVNESGIPTGGTTQIPTQVDPGGN